MRQNPLNKNLDKATLFGYHGMSNFGDDIFLRVIVELLRSRLGLEHLYVTARPGHIPREINGVELIPIIPASLRITRLKVFIVFYYALQSRLLCFGAGSLFTVFPFASYAFLLRLLRFFRRQRSQVIALGVSVGPLKTGSQTYWCRRLLDRMDAILLRDTQSKMLISHGACRAKVFTGYDLALLWEPGWHQNVAASGKYPILGLCLNYSGRGNGAIDGVNASVAATIFRAISKLMGTDPKIAVRIFIVCTDTIYGDQQASDDVRELFADHGIIAEVYKYDGISPEAFLANMKDCFAMITSRMHAGVLCLMQEIPTYQISYAAKIDAFYGHCRLQQDFLFRPQQITESSLTEFIIAARNGILNNYCTFQRTNLSLCKEHLQAQADMILAAH